METCVESNISILVLHYCLDDDSHGQMFHSKYFPTLRYFIHTGFDVENGKLGRYVVRLLSYGLISGSNIGCLNFKSLMLPDPINSKLAQVEGSVNDDTPIYRRIKKGRR